MSVDYEERVDFDRLRTYRLARAKASLEASECGALSCSTSTTGTSPPSGLGREGGHEGMLEFTESKYIAAQW